MKKLLSFIVTQLVDHPEEVEIFEETDQNGIIKLTLKVADSEMGKIIGKQGRIIRALRSLLKVKAIKTNQQVFLELAES